ncbi:MAG: response regulator transcription factor [Azonexus sp.]
MIRLLLADDHALVREGLKQLFALTADLEVAAEASNGGQVLDILRNGQFSIVVLDMTMPGICGPDLIQRIRAGDNPPPILVLSMHNEPQIARRALASGAAGYLTKDSDPETLLAAIRKVAAGGRFLGPALAEALAFETTGSPGNSHEQLTDREFQILNLLAHGHSVNKIADQLAISAKTVSTHKARLMEKMGFASNADIVRYAISQGLVD